MAGVDERTGSLTAAEAATIIRAQFPALGGLQVARLGEGTDHCAFDVGGLLVFRFPRADEGAAALAVEARLTTWIAPRLPLAIPSYRYFGRPRAAFPRSFAGYEKLAGTPALLVDQLDPIDLAAAGRRMGDFLGSLHGLDDADVAAAAALGVPPDDDPTLEAWSTAALADLRFCFERGHVDAPSATEWERFLASPPSTTSAARRLVHGDLAAEHVLLDEQGVPRAVIDWSDAVVGDPALNLAGLIHWGGQPMLSAALETYTGAADQDTLGRARWFAACRAVADIAFGETQQRRAYVRAGLRALAWLGDPRRLSR